MTRRLKSMAGRLASSLLAACALAVVMGGPEAHAYDLSALDGAETVSDGELSEMRGEFIDISGLKIGFGAEVRTFANGVLMLSTQFAWTPQGIVATSNASELASRIDATVAAQLSTLGVHGVAGGEGYAMLSETGGTAVIHRADSNGIQNFLINSQSGTAFHQEMTLSFELPGFDVMQANMDVDRIGLQLRDDIIAASMTWR
jgi:hypothetical protein